MKKVLFVATMQSHIMYFHLPYIKMFTDEGYEVYVATKLDRKIYKDVKMENVKWIDIDFSRSPISKNTIKSAKEMSTLLKENKFELIHTHTPIASIITRICARRLNINNIIYTAHGFHFFKGSPIQNWIIYYPIEKIMARFTDAIVTINDEDYNLAYKKFNTRNSNNIFKVNGVGVDFEKYKIKNVANLKESLNIKESDFVLSIIGELNDNKNQIQLIKALEEINADYNNIKCLIIGYGENQVYLENYIKEHNLDKNIFMLGYRTDIPELLNITDVVVSMSKREGLPKNLIEAMSVGRPIIATAVRGNMDLVNEENGVIVQIDDIEATKLAILKLYENDSLVKKLGESSKEKSKKYDLKNTKLEMKKIYKKIIGN